MLGMLERERQRDTPAHGGAEDVRHVNAERIEEGRGVVGHHLNRGGDVRLGAAPAPRLSDAMT